MENIEEIAKLALEFGATHTGIIDVADIELDSEFRKACEANYCGHYNKNWTCPPKVGKIDDLIEEVKTYRKAVVFQTVGKISDSYDFEGMEDVVNEHEKVVRKIFSYCKSNYKDFLVLSVGGCKYCKRCQLLDDKPCISEENAIASLEAYGIYVTSLASKSGMKYINGQNTVTYFGMILFK